MRAGPLPAEGRRPGGQQIVPRPAAWEPGPTAPFATTAAPSLEELLRRVSRHSHPFAPAFPGARHSAVLVVLAPSPSGVDRGVEVLLTRRSMDMRTHRGEISFPGGRLDPGETAAEAALREAHEEVGLDPALVTVEGELEHLNTVGEPQLHRARRRHRRGRRSNCDRTAPRSTVCCGCRSPSSSDPTRTAPSGGAHHRPIGCSTSSSSTTKRSGEQPRRCSIQLFSREIR